MRTEAEWQAREAELLEANNSYLERARKAERSLEAAHNKKPQLFWFADDPEQGHSDLHELLDYVDDTYQVVEIDTGYYGPTFFAAYAWTADGGRSIVRADTRAECQRLADQAKQARADEENAAEEEVS